jgi:hypothetical protein
MIRPALIQKEVEGCRGRDGLKSDAERTRLLGQSRKQVGD